MSSPSDAEVIGRSLDEPEVFGLIYDRHAPTVLRFLGRRVGAGVAEGLVGELFRIAFERRKTFDASRVSALPWLYGIGSNLLLKHRRAEARRLHASARMAAGEAAHRRACTAALDARLLLPRVADAIEALPGFLPRSSFAPRFPSVPVEVKPSGAFTATCERARMPTGAPGPIRCQYARTR
jgi:DNA-directed RNA polymerase specialized sigma24 family protein